MLPATPQEPQPDKKCYRIVETWDGPMLINMHDQYLGRVLHIYGEYARDEANLLMNLMPKDGYVVYADVGANIGTLTIPIAKALGSRGVVHSFEPQRLTYQMLCANIALNECWNIHAHMIGLGEKDETIMLPVIHPSSHNFNWGGVSLPKESTEGEPTAIKRLDDLGLPALHVLKGDVEGMEMELLLGGRETIMKHRPHMYLENDRKPKAPALIKMLMDDLDYDCWWHLPGIVTQDNFNAIELAQAYGVVVSLNLLCLPKGPDHKIEGPFTKIEDPDYWPPDHWNKG